MKENKRLLSLDVFRGLTVAAMIFVNNPGSWTDVYYPFLHGDWNDCTFTDLIAPFFLFSVGLSMAYSLRNALTGDRSKLIKKILRRVLVIFSIGMILAACPLNYWSVGVRIFGVLQRIAIAYGVAAILCIYLDKIKLALLSLFILIFYWLLLYFGGQGDPYSYGGSFLTVMETKLFGNDRLLFGWAYFEGTFSLLPSVVNVLYGYLIGKFIQCSNNIRNTSYILFFAGLLLMLLAKLWEIVLPFNLTLWTSSFVVYCSAWASMIFAFILWLVDVNGYKKWAEPFKAYGMNPLFIYFTAEMWAAISVSKFTLLDGSVTNIKKLSFEGIFVPVADYMNGSILFALWHVFIFWLLAYIMYKKKIFIKI